METKMDTIISTLSSQNQNLHQNALQTLLTLTTKTDLNTLKLLNDNRDTLRTLHTSPTLTPENKLMLADILSCVYMLTDTDTSLEYRIVGNTISVGVFGHQYVKKLMGAIVTKLKRGNSPKDEDRCDVSEIYYSDSDQLVLKNIVLACSKFMFSSNCECDGIDFLLELNLNRYISFFIDDHNFKRSETYLSELCFYESVEDVLVNVYRRRGENVKLILAMVRAVQGASKIRVSYKCNNERLVSDNDRKVNINDLNYNSNNNIPCKFYGDLAGMNKIKQIDLTSSEDATESVYVFDTAKFDEYVDYVLGVCEWCDFMQILFILSRMDICMDEDRIRRVYSHRNDKTNNKEEFNCNVGSRLGAALSVINNGYLSEISTFVHRDLQLLEPFRLEKFLKGITKIDKEITLKYFTPICMSNSFVYFGYGSDMLLLSSNEYNVDLKMICESEKIEVIGVLASLGQIKKNRTTIRDEITKSDDDNTSNSNTSNSTSVKPIDNNNNSSNVKPIDNNSSNDNNNNGSVKSIDSSSVKSIDINNSSVKPIDKTVKSCNLKSDNTVNPLYTYLDDLVEGYSFQDGYSYKKSGALLSRAIQSTCYDNDHSLFALLEENLSSPCRFMKISSLLAVHSLYSCKNYLTAPSDTDTHSLEFIKQSLIPVLYAENIETAGMACYTLGSIFIGSRDQELVDNMISVMVERRESDGDSVFYLYVVLGLALLYYGTQDMSIESVFGGYSSVLSGIAHVGTGDTSYTIDELVEEYINLSDRKTVLSENKDIKSDDEDDSKGELNTKSELKTTKGSDKSELDSKGNDKGSNKEPATINSNKESTTIKSTTMNSNVGVNNSVENNSNVSDNNDPIPPAHLKALILLSITIISLNDQHTRACTKKLLITHMYRDTSNIIPLCLGLLSTSDPDVEIIDALSRSINTNDPVPSVLGLGLIGAGTNNSRIMKILESQYSYVGKNSKLGSLLKIAQGMVVLGKGMLCMSPLMCDKTIVVRRRLVAMLGVLYLFVGNTYPLLGKHSFLLYLLGECVGSKYVITLDEDLGHVDVTVRVGRPVQTVGMAGKPKGIAAVVTNDSPVVVSCDERADIYEEEGWKYSGFVEDVVIVRKCGGKK